MKWEHHNGHLCPKESRVSQSKHWQDLHTVLSWFPRTVQPTNLGYWNPVKVVNVEGYVCILYTLETRLREGGPRQTNGQSCIVLQCQSTVMCTCSWPTYVALQSLHPFLWKARNTYVCKCTCMPISQKSYSISHTQEIDSILQSLAVGTQ